MKNGSIPLKKINRVQERSKEHVTDQALQAQAFKKTGSKSKGKDKPKTEGSHLESSKKDGDQVKPSLRSIHFNQEKKGKSQSGIKNVQCYNCQKYGHFAKDRRGEGSQKLW